LRGPPASSRAASMTAAPWQPLGQNRLAAQTLQSGQRVSRDRRLPVALAKLAQDGSRFRGPQGFKNLDRAQHAKVGGRNFLAFHQVEKSYCLDFRIERRGLLE